MWTAIYLYGLEGDPSEIDIMEQLNGKADNFVTNYHVGGKQNLKNHTIPNISDGFHYYKLWWYKNKLRFGFDNKILRTCRCRVRKITPNQCLIMNNAVRANPDLTTLFIRGVKVWEI
jgi:beta-glucanase (GH16 family)